MNEENEDYVESRERRSEPEAPSSHAMRDLIQLVRGMKSDMEERISELAVHQNDMMSRMFDLTVETTRGLVNELRDELSDLGVIPLSKTPRGKDPDERSFTTPRSFQTPNKSKETVARESDLHREMMSAAPEVSAANVRHQRREPVRFALDDDDDVDDVPKKNRRESCVIEDMRYNRRKAEDKQVITMKTTEAFKGKLTTLKPVDFLN